MNGAVPGAVLRAAAAFDVEPAQVTPLGGATGTTFAAGPHVLRIGGTARLDREVRAMAAASVAVPVPQVLGTTEVGDDGDGDDPTAALLLSRLPGVEAGDLDDVSVTEPTTAERSADSCTAHWPGSGPPRVSAPSRRGTRCCTSTCTRSTSWSTPAE